MFFAFLFVSFFFLFAIVVFLFVCVRAIVCGGGVLIDNGDVNCYRHFVVVFNVDLKSVKEDKQDVILFAWGSLFFFHVSDVFITSSMNSGRQHTQSTKGLLLGIGEGSSVCVPISS